MTETTDPWSDRLISVNDRRSPKLGHTLMTLVMIGVLGLAVLDGFGVVDVYGVDQKLVTVASNDTTLELRYASVSRPGLATPLGFTVSRPGGFDAPIEVAVASEYLDGLDVNYVSPTPSAETSMGEWVIWSFDEIVGDRLDVQVDARMEPGAQSSAPGSVGLVEDGVVVEQADFTTRIWP